MVKVINPHNSLMEATLIGQGTLVLGYGSEVRKGVIIEINGGVISIGNYSVIGYNSFIQATGDLTVGTGSLLGPFNSFICSTHVPTKGVPLNQVPLKKGKIVIKDNVWSGANTIFNEGVEVGDNVVIGAASFANKDIPNNQVWAGVPAKFIKFGVES